MNVQTWHSPRGNTVDLSAAQERLLKRHRTWPRDPVDGQEFCSVSFSWHRGIPTYATDADLLRSCGVEP